MNKLEIYEKQLSDTIEHDVSVPFRIETTAKKIRAKTHALRSEKLPCYVCGGHALIAQAHHIYSLKMVAMIANGFRLKEIEEPPTVWLCPNCHSYVHKCIDNPELFNGEMDLPIELIHGIHKVVMLNYEYANILRERYCKDERFNDF